MNTKNRLSIIAAITLLAASCTKTTTNQSPAELLIATINSNIENGAIMLGHQDATVYGHSWKYEPNRSDVLEIVGDYPAVIGWEIGGIELGDAENLDGVPFDLIRSEIAAHHNRGGINTISWHTFRPDGLDSWQEEEGIVTSILEGGENYDKFQAQLGIVADFFSSLKTAKEEAIPIIFRPWHEHEGSWFWWGDQWCSHAEYLQLWDMTYDFMAERGLDNIVWCYMPMPETDDKTPSPEKFDMVGVDVYQYQGNVEKYISDMKSDIEMMKEYSHKYDKPITISETGAETLLTENWFCEILLPLIENEPISYVLLWRNAWDKPDHHYCSYKGHSSEDDFHNFVNHPSIITVKEIDNLKR